MLKLCAKMPPGKDKVHDYFHTEELKRTDESDGSIKVSKRISCTIPGCNFSAAFRNVDQLVNHLADAGVGAGFQTGCKHAPDAVKEEYRERQKARDAEKKKEGSKKKMRAAIEVAEAAAKKPKFEQTALGASFNNQKVSQNLELELNCNTYLFIPILVAPFAKLTFNPALCTLFGCSQKSVEEVEDALGRWVFGTGVPPNALQGELWDGLWVAIRNAPPSMPIPRRRKVSNEVLTRLNQTDEDEVTIKMHDPAIEKYGWTSSTDAGTVHGESVTVFNAHLPSEKKPFLLGFVNSSKSISLAGGKSAMDEARLFLKKVKETRGDGKHLTLLCTDTPAQMRAMFHYVETALPQLFWQSDICHSSSLGLKEVAKIPEIAAVLEEIIFVNPVGASTVIPTVVPHILICIRYITCAF